MNDTEWQAPALTAHEDAVLNAIGNAREKIVKASVRILTHPSDPTGEDKFKEGVLANAAAVERAGRVLRGNGWNTAHDEFCPTPARECWEHVNPYVEPRS